MVTESQTEGALHEFHLVLMPSGRRGRVWQGTRLLDAARSMGVELESVCGGKQTCGKCQIYVEEGDFQKHGITSIRDHVSPEGAEEAEYWQRHGRTGRRLACAAKICGDLLISVPVESQAKKQFIAKSATDCLIDVHATIREYYVECTPARIEDGDGDWERLQAALAQQWQLTEISIALPALRQLQPALRAGHSKVTVAVWQNREVVRVRAGYAEGIYGLALDVGTTTIVAHVCDLRTGRILATEAMVNPQVRYGEDLMSRVSYTMLEPEGAARLHGAVLEAINDLARGVCARAKLTKDDVLDIVLVGNSVMHHLLLGIDPVELGGAPFALAVSGALDFHAAELGLTQVNPAAHIYVLPCIAGQNGADNVAVILAEAPHRQEEMTLLVDVGTNAEIVLGNSQGVAAASSPTGPAFEGAQITFGQRAAAGAIEQVRISKETLEASVLLIGSKQWIGGTAPSDILATGICGSGIIAAVAEMYLAGIIDSEGRFVESAAERSSRVRFAGRTGEYVLVPEQYSSSGQPIVITQSDVRAVQLAKGALYAGVKLLMKKRGVEKIDRILLAGAFGSYISPWHAMVLGMVPDCPLEKITAVGNAAGEGAVIALLNIESRREAQELAESVEYLSLALDPGFQEEFVAAMALPHARDRFPHLEEQLPVKTISRTRTRRRQPVFR